MPRGRRYIVPGQVYHVTHRCHNRSFLLKFKKDRTVYRQMLRERIASSGLSLLSYCITSNHVHLLLRPDPTQGDGLDTLSRFMRSLQGDFSLFYNRRKGRQNAFWGDRYHATMIESGAHLWQCLVYIDLNMVRAGVVRHPEEWEWTAYRELVGSRVRYRLVDRATLLEQIGAESLAVLRENYIHCVQQALGRQPSREAKWTESLAVGSAGFVNRIGRQIRHRMQVEIVADRNDPNLWQVRERSADVAWGSFRAAESACKTPESG
jgi:putative transposase